MGRKKKRLNSFRKEKIKHFDRYTLEYIELDQLIFDLKSYNEQYGDKYEKLYVEFDLDWSSCYYEGDSPNIQCELFGEKGCWETDEEYERRCGYPPSDGMEVK